MFILLLLGGLSFGMLQEGLAERGAVRLDETRWRALEIAEMGLLKAEMELRANVDADGDGLGVVAGDFGGGRYETTATEVDPTGGLWRVTASGTHGLSRRRLETGVRVTQRGLWQHAMFGKTSVTMSGNSWTDSYDSSKGSYASQKVHVDALGAYAGLQGHVGSNGQITLSGGAIRGDAIPGPLSITKPSGGAIIYGDTAPRSAPYDAADPPYADFAAAWAKNDNLSVNVSGSGVSYNAATGVLSASGGAPITLPGGTFIYNTLKMSGGGTLYVTGPTKIYITNYFEISGGGIANLTGKPENCLIFSHPYDFPAGSKHDKKYVKTSGGSNTFFAVYAPTNHYETSGGGDLTGSVVANTIVFSGGSGFHYDEALGKVGGGSADGPTERVYWIELDALP
jgi:hypothetical protein